MKTVAMRCPVCGGRLQVDTADRVDVEFFSDDNGRPDYDYSGEWEHQSLGVWCVNNHSLGRFPSLDAAAVALVGAL